MVFELFCVQSLVTAWTTDWLPEWTPFVRYNSASAENKGCQEKNTLGMGTIIFCLSWPATCCSLSLRKGNLFVFQKGQPRQYIVKRAIYLSIKKEISFIIQVGIIPFYSVIFCPLHSSVPDLIIFFIMHISLSNIYL